MWTLRFGLVCEILILTLSLHCVTGCNDDLEGGNRRSVDAAEKKSKSKKSQEQEQASKITEVVEASEKSPLKKTKKTIVLSNDTEVEYEPSKPLLKISQTEEGSGLAETAITQIPDS